MLCLGSQVPLVSKKMQPPLRAPGELHPQRDSRRLRQRDILHTVDVGALVYKATRIVENTVHWEKKEWAERRISLKDTQYKIGSGAYKKMGDKKTCSSAV